MNRFGDTAGACPGAIDMSVVESLRELGGEEDPGLVVELIGMFLEDAPQRIEEIESALLTDNIKLLERAAHTLKSSAANVGAMGLSRLCKEMEERARRNDMTEMQNLYQASKRSFDDAACVLRCVQ